MHSYICRRDVILVAFRQGADFLVDNFHCSSGTSIAKSNHHVLFRLDRDTLLAEFAIPACLRSSTQHCDGDHLLPFTHGDLLVPVG